MIFRLKNIKIKKLTYILTQTCLHETFTPYQKIIYDVNNDIEINSISL